MSPTEPNDLHNAPPKEALPKAYDPSTIEQRWADFWVSEKLFDVATPEASTQSDTKKFAGAPGLASGTWEGTSPGAPGLGCET